MRAERPKREDESFARWRCCFGRDYDKVQGQVTVILSKFYQKKKKFDKILIKLRGEGPIDWWFKLDFYGQKKSELAPSHSLHSRSSNDGVECVRRKNKLTG